MEVMILITNKYHYDPPTKTEPLFWGCEGNRRKAVFHIGEKQLQTLCSLYQDYFLAEVSSAEVFSAALLQEKKATLDTTASNKTNFFIFLKF